MEEKQLFKNLHKSEIGKQIVAYCEQVVGEIYDSRTWKEHETRETADHAARVFQEKLINKIKLQNDFKQVEKNPYS